MKLELYYLTAYFLLYSFLGWCIEVIWHAACHGAIVNRGFLNGPVCPIYGFGMLLVLTFLNPLKDNLILLFIGSVLLTSLLELSGGFILYKVFKIRWWDYSDKPFNIGGYICLQFSIAWGLLVTAAVKIVHPFVALNVHILNNTIGYILITLAFIIFLVDCVCTFLTVTKLNKDLALVNNLTSSIRKVSDGITEKVSVHTIESTAKLQESRVQLSLGLADLKDRMKETKDKLTSGKYTGYGRLYQAFPGMSHAVYKDELNDAKERNKTKYKRK